MINDYIFCPLCGGVKWITDKTGFANDGKLEYHKCAACKNSPTLIILLRLITPLYLVSPKPPGFRFKQISVNIAL